MEVSRWPSKSHVSTPWVSVGVRGPVVATWAAVREAPSLAAPSRPQDGQGDSVAPGKKEQLGRQHNGCSRQIQTAKFSYFGSVSNKENKRGEQNGSRLLILLCLQLNTRPSWALRLTPVQAMPEQTQFHGGRLCLNSSPIRAKLERMSL